MRLPPFPERLLRALSPAGERHGLLLAGGHALRALGFTDRLVERIELVTAAGHPLPAVADDVVAALRAGGLLAEVAESTPWAARLTVEDASTGRNGEIVLTREALREPPVVCDGLPVAGAADVIGLRVRDLHERGLPADVADAAAAAQEFSFRDLERLAAAHLDDFSPRELLMRLEFVELMSDERFEAHGLDERHIADIRACARAWAEDIKLRRADDGDADYDDPDLPEID
ncbi:nucleotidyl transferase AbiEii/AbiGii toxin family protein [Nonomuraea sp. NPDC001699]